ncbi:TadE family protein [Anaerolinea thermophila]|uniref:TadE-like domain-containing protein n=1 Tax=Anaerolinea thermophila (strain DSM 14523 / JCM 11388 / NBRC 100420 / UNI-1) TaxID=926569 RepID=E8N693_ANATU|nr:TadE/TadG family type IV pilus assembly protein [Anaerolinea thermophila]BAJ63957.1 hypothetical protein ANT_19310 [Anaerolinea thermophila UNI-1]
MLNPDSKKTPSPSKRRGQSFVELALILPILLVMLLGLVEVAIFVGRYLDVLDLTREAARFASVKDPFFIDMPGYWDCSGNQFFFYFHTACIFSPPSDQETEGGICWDRRFDHDNDPSTEIHDPFCNGLNPFITLDLTTDDVVISVYTVDGNNTVSRSHPGSNPDPRFAGDSVLDENGNITYFWALSNHDWDTAHNNNWQKDCQGNVVRQRPHYTTASVQQIINSSSVLNAQGTPVPAPGTKGYVAVELFYCYKQALNVPLFNVIVPNPVMIHAYTIMPLPAAQPTPTPIPSNP